MWYIPCSIDVIHTMQYLYTIFTLCIYIYMHTYIESINNSVTSHYVQTNPISHRAWFSMFFHTPSIFSPCFSMGYSIVTALSSGSLSQSHLHADAPAAGGLSIFGAQGGSVDHDLLPYHCASVLWNQSLTMVTMVPIHGHVMEFLKRGVGEL